MDSINPRFNKYIPLTQPDITKLFTDIKSGNRSALSQGLTLLESKLPEHRNLADALLEMAIPLSGNSIRLGISGVPGVGKSTFIETFGEYLINKANKQVAVLAIDPSSGKNRGSILGDKTRMDRLSNNSKAYIRPSPTSGQLGGVAGKTREAIIICEAAGYDLILVETVGVGQSEVAVKSMVDFFLLLMLAGAGDELQGIKRGIMEMADLLVINKADGANLSAARKAKGEYQRALHLFPQGENHWSPKVVTASALENQGMEEVWEVVQEFIRLQQELGNFIQNREKQLNEWFTGLLEESLMYEFFRNKEVITEKEKLKADILKGKISVNKAVRTLLEQHFKKF